MKALPSFGKENRRTSSYARFQSLLLGHVPSQSVGKIKSSVSGTSRDLILLTCVGEPLQLIRFIAAVSEDG